MREVIQVKLSEGTSLVARCSTLDTQHQVDTTPSHQQ